MKRKLEIINSKRTVQFFAERDLDKPLCINTAIEWADKTMIEKACEWLESMLKSDLGYYGVADFVDTFRKAMLEEK